MLVESFVASTGFETGKVNNDSAKDTGIFIYEYLPTVQQKAGLKKSSTAQNCLATSQNHVFAAQADKAVVNVYNRDKGSQEAIVPFREKITCVALACEDSVLVLGTAEGRLFLWETQSGRQITTNQAHVQAVTAIAVTVASDLIVSVSADGTAHIWSIPALLSFQNVDSLRPSHTFDEHRTAIEAVGLGHSASYQNFAITASEDKTCLIWDLYAGTLLKTILLPSIPACLNIEAADRAFYIGYDDGSLQQVSLLNLLPSDLRRTNGSEPIQIGDNKRWKVPGNSHGAMLCMSLTFDATTVITGHKSGSILSWDVSNGHVRTLPIQPPILKPITNLAMLSITGYHEQEVKIHNITTIVKPKFGAFQSSGVEIPGDYALRLQITTSKSSNIAGPRDIFPARTIPQEWVDGGLEELHQWSNKQDQISSNNKDEMDGIESDYMSLEGPIKPDLERQNAELRAQLASLRNVQMASFDQIEKLSLEKQTLLQREQKRLQDLAKVNGGTLRNTDMANHID